MLNNLIKKLADLEFVSGKLTLVFLLIFQWMLYFAVVDQNESNLLPIRHVIKIDSFEENAPEPGTLTVTSRSRYQTDSVEIVNGHFFHCNITLQLLLLSLLAIIAFHRFQKMRIYPAPFLIPLFIILTISIFYHNYLGHRIIDRVSVPIEQILCDKDCDSKDKDRTDIVTCEEGVNSKGKDKCKDYKKIPDKYITAETKGKEGKQVKEFKIDKHKLGEIVNEAARIYPADPEDQEHGRISLKKNLDPTPEESDINKYERASADSKKHFGYIFLGFICFFVSMIFAKFFSKVKDFSDSEFCFLTFIVLVLSWLTFIPAKFTHYSITTTLVEFLKLFAILLTVIGYEKINKNKINFRLYIVTLVCEFGILLLLNDLGNAIILGIIIILTFLLTLTWPLQLNKKHYSVLIPLIIVAIIGGYTFFKDPAPSVMQNKWRLFDTWQGLNHPQYSCEIKADDNKLEHFSKKNAETVKNAFNSLGEEKKLEFFSFNGTHEIRLNSKNEIVVVNNCKDNEDKNFMCDLVYDFSKAAFVDNSQVECNKDEYSRQNCRQVNKDARLAMFAILKDGFSGNGHSGFKENTFLLGNYFMYTDFVFCGLIAFFGIWLTLLVVFCIGALVWNSNILPKECGNNYKHFLYSNIMVVILGAQAFIHIGGNLNVLPFTGVILPFLSKGGASTIVAFITLGFALGGLVSDEYYNDLSSLKSVKILLYVLGKFRGVAKVLGEKLLHIINKIGNIL